MRTSWHLVALGTLLSSAALLSACGSSGTSKASSPLSATQTPGGCPDDLDFFRTRLWEPVMSVQCIACHKTGGLAAGTRMVLVPPTEPNAVQTNFATVSAIAREQIDGTSLLLLKPSGRAPTGHVGGTLLTDGSARYADFQRFTQRIAGVAGACDATTPVAACVPGGLDPSARRQVRLLTRFEYDNTLTDLLYLDTPSTWGQSLPSEEVVNGFDNTAAVRTVGQLLTDKLLAASEQAAVAAVAKLSMHVTCSPGDSCAAQYIQGFGARAFREPLTATELARYQTLYTSVAAEDGYLEGLKAVTSAMLLSPRFLYRSELGQSQGGGLYTLSDWEVASELSYLFWGSMPDEALFAKAKAGLLHTPEQLSAEARRLLGSPRSRPVMDHFVSQWLDLDKIDHVEKDAALFTYFGPTVRTAMKDETRELFDRVVRGGTGQLSELFTADYTYATDTLAAFYGLSTSPEGTPTAAGLRRWSLKDSGRGGVLTHGSILTAQATPQTSSPVRRGKLVRERLLCQPLPAAPPGLNLQLTPVDDSQPNRVRFQQHSSNAACAACHHLMDPVGFGFERFNSVGVYKPQEKNGGLVDQSGEVLDSPSTAGTFDGVGGLQAKLARSTDVQGCFSLQWLRFAYGVSGDEESCVASQLADRFRQQSLSIPELLVTLTQLPRFTQRWGEAAAPQPDPSGGTPSSSGGTTGGTTGSTGGGTTGSTGGGTSGTPSTPTTTTGGMQVTESVQSDWGSGYCHAVKVVNTGTAPLTWSVNLPVEGTVNNTWNTTPTGSGGGMTFSGLDFNAQLQPGASTSFGYCATR